MEHSGGKQRIYVAKEIQRLTSA